jgi:predicted amidohydrolase YtcJ
MDTPMLIKGFRANATDLVLALSASLVLSVSLASFAQPASAQQGSVASSETDAAPDLVLIHGRVLTVDAHDSIAQALAIKAGKIVEVGTDSSVTSLIGKDTHVIDLHGLTVTPGLIDSHGHFAEGGVNELFSVDLSNAARIEDVLNKLAEKVATVKPGEWITGDGWDEGKLEEHRYVYAADIDRVVPNNPVWLTHTTGHYGVANTLAMKLGHITRETQPPPAGTIDRDKQGEPTGVLKEAAMSLVTQLIPPTTPQQEKEGILHSIEGLHREGMTAVKDADIHSHTWDSYRDLLAEGKLTIRVFVLWHAGTSLDSARETLNHILALPRPPQSLGDGKLLSGGAKLYMDGSGGARTAWLYDEWNKNSSGKDAGNYGYPATDPEVYRQEVRLFHDAGVHVGTHAIGDRAIDWVVDTYAQVLKEKPTVGLRHSIIHANIPTDHAIAEMATLEKQYDAAYPESQAPFIWWIGDTYAGNFGPERSARLNPFNTYLAKGVHWGGGSDYFVTPYPARYGIWASVERQTLKGVYGEHPFGMAEAVDVHAALRSYTSWAARQLFLEDQVGTIEKGKKADIAVWNKDWYMVPSSELKNVKSEMTIFDGEIVYKATDTPITVGPSR